MEDKDDEQISSLTINNQIPSSVRNTQKPLIGTLDDPVIENPLALEKTVYNNIWIHSNNKDPDITCDVCQWKEDDLGDRLVCCNDCNVATHQSCYGGELVDLTDQELDGYDFTCMRCKEVREKNKKPSEILCNICQTIKGCVIKTNHGWAHLTCINWIEELSFEPAEEKRLIKGFIDKERRGLFCSLCHTKNQRTFLIQCDFRDCQTNFHVRCAITSGNIKAWDEMNEQRENKYSEGGFVFCHNHQIDAMRVLKSQGAKGLDPTSNAQRQKQLYERKMQLNFQQKKSHQGKKQAKITDYRGESVFQSVNGGGIELSDSDHSQKSVGSNFCDEEAQVHQQDQSQILSHQISQKRQKRPRLMNNKFSLKEYHKACNDEIMNQELDNKIKNPKSVKRRKLQDDIDQQDNQDDFVDPNQSTVPQTNIMEPQNPQQKDVYIETLKQTLAQWQKLLKKIDDQDTDPLKQLRNKIFGSDSTMIKSLWSNHKLEFQMNNPQPLQLLELTDQQIQQMIQVYLSNTGKNPEQPSQNITDNSQQNQSEQGNNQMEEQEEEQEEIDDQNQQLDPMRTQSMFADYSDVPQTPCRPLTNLDGIQPNLYGGQLSPNPYSESPNPYAVAETPNPYGVAASPNPFMSQSSQLFPQPFMQQTLLPSIRQSVPNDSMMFQSQAVQNPLMNQLLAPQYTPSFNENQALIPQIQNVINPNIVRQINSQSLQALSSQSQENQAALINSQPSGPPKFKAQKTKKPKKNDEDQIETQVADLQKKINQLQNSRNKPLTIPSQQPKQSVSIPQNHVSHPQMNINQPFKQKKPKNLIQKKVVQNIPQNPVPQKMAQQQLQNNSNNDKSVSASISLQIDSYFSHLLDLDVTEETNRLTLQQSFIAFAIQNGFVTEKDHSYRIPEVTENKGVKWIYKKLKDNLVKNKIKDVGVTQNPDGPGDVISFSPKRLYTILRVFIIE